MRSTYKKKLSRTEAKRHFVYIEKIHRDLFPPNDETFIVIVDNQRIEAAVGSKNRIMAAIFWERLSHFSEGDTIIISKNSDDSFNVSIEE